MLIISAPSGAGKSSFVERACREVPRLRDTVTFTTRSMRRGEAEGQPYHFVSQEKFKELVDSNFFVEWAMVHENYYGTPWYQLDEAWAKNEVIIMDVDVQGTRTFKSKFPDAVSIFILPPSINELKRRIISRDGGAPKDLDIRLSNAAEEMAHAPEFDHRVVNDEFESSYQEFRRLIESLISFKS